MNSMICKCGHLTNTVFCEFDDANELVGCYLAIAQSTGRWVKGCILDEGTVGTPL